MAKKKEIKKPVVKKVEVKKPAAPKTAPKKAEAKKVEVKKVAAPKAPAKKQEIKKVDVKKVAPKKAASANEYPYVELVHPLLTQNYTKILHEDPFRFNAPHLFKVIKAEPEASGEHKGQNLVVGLVHFQEGPIKECGVNGVANEDLIGMVLARLLSFQKSEYKCKENAEAVKCLMKALEWLRKRTNGRVKRGVEGTSKV